MKSSCSIEGCGKTGERRGMCQMHFWRLQHHGSPAYQPWPERKCSVNGCERKHKKRGLCALHARRQSKGIPFDFRRPALAKKRYRVLTRPDHPLAIKNGRVTEHRMALYDSTGGSRLPCFWCGAPLEWGVNLVVDHDNHDRHDNRPENLRPACNGCNAGRTVANPRVRRSVYQPHFPVGAELGT